VQVVVVVWWLCLAKAVEVGSYLELLHFVVVVVVAVVGEMLLRV